jgi:hypothetical protein
MDVVFKIRKGDLRRAIRELQVNRGSHVKDDRVAILVSGYAATFRAPGTDSEYPVDGIIPGVAHMPIAVLSRIKDMLTANESELRITNGAVMSGKLIVKHEAIKVGEIPNIRVQVPIDPSPFELIVIGRILGEELIVEQGLESCLESATDLMNQAISKAASHLSPFGITNAALRSLVDSAIESAKGDVKAGVYS